MGNDYSSNLYEYLVKKKITSKIFLKNIYVPETRKFQCGSNAFILDVIITGIHGRISQSEVFGFGAETIPSAERFE